MAFLPGLCIPLPDVAWADWQATEIVRTYAISGKSGAALYQSIGVRGPKVSGERRAIAHTSFRLTWTRKYQVQAKSCILATAVPKLTITYTLPRPAGALPDGMRQSWDKFIAGVAAHEKVHGELIRNLTRQIEAATIGLTVPDDPDCRKIKPVMTERLSALAATHRKRNSDFDQAELSPGGKVHQLILELVNGP